MRVKVLTGVSGSREKRLSLSSLLAERIRSSVSEMYCKRNNNWRLNHQLLM